MADFDPDGVPGLADDQPVRANVESAVLGYIIFGQDSSNGWTGAVMLTDSRTRPLHFGFATPIRPGPLQRLLYGSTLDEYVKVDVIANQLIKDLPRVPDVIFVESHELVAVRRVAPFPVASLVQPQTAENGSSLSIVQFKTAENTDDHDQIAPLVSALETSANLLDPFARMREAIKEALKEAQKVARTPQA